jgi:hypothetical protein
MVNKAQRAIEFALPDLLFHPDRALARRYVNDEFGRMR